MPLKRFRGCVYREPIDRRVILPPYQNDSGRWNWVRQSPKERGLVSVYLFFRRGGIEI